MSKFSIGDRVKIVADNTKEKAGGHLIGREGVVSAVRVSAQYKYVVETPEGGVLARASELELVTKKFKTGDLVRVVRDDHQTDFGNLIGSTGVVRMVTQNKTYNTLVQLEDGRSFRGAEHELELLSGETIVQTTTSEVEAEAVEHPAHYGGDTPYEVIKVAEAWGFHDNAYLFNALKYLARAEKKGKKIEDLKKLVFYVEREIALEEAK